MICETMDEALALITNPKGVDFDATFADHDGTIIGKYQGEPVEVKGHTCSEFYDFGCLKFFGVRDPFTLIEPFEGFDNGW